MRKLSVLILSLTLFACGNSADVPDQPSASPAEIADNQYIQAAEGLTYHDIKKGTGLEATKGKHAIVHYTGWLTTGKIFDSSIIKNKPFSVNPLGGGQVIKGWDEGIVGMRVGGHRQLVIPPNLAYGPDGYPGAIPPNATLIFEVYLLEIK
ncbi:MAG: FKBP-type peptidyl-prolyl cis-trans isomerase [Candidatus Latescibacteria bacterium]|jgi:FKBP-type peptidyl-prolyl cis-trans isomerase|nr:FKBP-type peptidyl-prolyl cis-trans isomerase [Candidatus Latescibacterota bacterium]MBT4137520.1 FKBP-type peptidyl-prolyl cis-trans isomerase [Candidatus Latescibacterota bacterium]MBT5830986.1 FKBP-type peptidyl-prolyl cis-trans isomerase [Candidatus Latescibacterota bacterium]